MLKSQAKHQEIKTNQNWVNPGRESTKYCGSILSFPKSPRITKLAQGLIGSPNSLDTASEDLSWYLRPV